MKKYLIVLSAALMLLAFSIPTMAAEEENEDSVDLSFDGYYRVRGEYWNNADTTDLGSNSYYNHRLRLSPTLTLAEDVSVHIVTDTFQAGGGNTGAWGESDFLDDAQLDSAFAAFEIRRAWGEIETGLGLLKLGRMGSNWGLGLFTNDGNALEDDFGDTVDRLEWVGKFGDSYVALIIDKLEENTLVDTATTDEHDDVDAYALAILNSTDEREYGAYLDYIVYNDADATAWIIDLYGKGTVGGVNLAGEAFYVSGSFDAGGFPAFATLMPNVEDITAYNLVVKGDYPINSASIGLEVGYFTGDDDIAVAADNDKLEQWSINRDYDIALIMFQPDALGINSTQGATLMIPVPRSNALYGKLLAGYDVSEDLATSLAIIFANANEDITNDEAEEETAYGWEVDLNLDYDITDNVGFGLGAGYWSPGAVYNDADGDVEAVTRVQGRFIWSF